MNSENDGKGGRQRERRQQTKRLEIKAEWNMKQKPFKRDSGTQDTFSLYFVCF